MRLSKSRAVGDSMTNNDAADARSILVGARSSWVVGVINPDGSPSLDRSDASF